MGSDVTRFAVKLRGQTCRGPFPNLADTNVRLVVRETSISVLANKGATCTICKYGMDFLRLSGKLTRILDRESGGRAGRR
jgi:hypothetical protein